MDTSVENTSPRPLVDINLNSTIVTNNLAVFTTDHNFDKNQDNICRKTIKATLLPTSKQEYILQRWFDSTTLMHNITVDYLKSKDKIIRAFQFKINECKFYLYKTYFLLEDFKQIMCMFKNFKKLFNKTFRNNQEYLLLFDWINKFHINNFKCQFAQLKHNYNSTIKQFRTGRLYDEACFDINVDKIKNISFNKLKFYHNCAFFGLIKKYELL